MFPLTIAELPQSFFFARSKFLPVFATSGNPAISLPLYWSEEGLPIGVQFVASIADEAILFQLATLIEEAFPWRDRRPPIHVRRSPS
jgi:amidase